MTFSAFSFLFYSFNAPPSFLLRLLLHRVSSSLVCLWLIEIHPGDSFNVSTSSCLSRSLALSLLFGVIQERKSFFLSVFHFILQIPQTPIVFHQPTTGKYLYVSFRGFYLSRHDPKFPPPINQSMSYYPDYQPECPTHSRVIVTTGDSEFSRW